MKRTLLSCLFSVFLGIGIHFTAIAYADAETCNSMLGQSETLEKVAEFVCESDTVSLEEDDAPALMMAEASD